MWAVADSPRGLSVNNVHNLVVACSKARKLQEYTTHGRIVREIRLQAVSLMCPCPVARCPAVHRRLCGGAEYVAGCGDCGWRGRATGAKLLWRVERGWTDGSPAKSRSDEEGRHSCRRLRQQQNHVDGGINQRVACRCCLCQLTAKLEDRMICVWISCKVDYDFMSLNTADQVECWRLTVWPCDGIVY